MVLSMGKLSTIASRVGLIGNRIPTDRSAARRTTGRTLQTIRFNMWKEDPHCARCGRITAYPYGFQIDHKIPLGSGGEDIDSNRQLLCVDEPNRDGCHTIKTREDIKGMGGILGS